MRNLLAAAVAGAAGAQRLQECSGLRYPECPCFLNRDTCPSVINGVFERPNENANGDIAQCRAACEAAEKCYGISWQKGACKLWAEPCDPASRPPGPYRLEPRACFAKGPTPLPTSRPSSPPATLRPPPPPAPPLVESGGGGGGVARTMLIVIGVIVGLCAALIGCRCCCAWWAASPRLRGSGSPARSDDPPLRQPPSPGRATAEASSCPLGLDISLGIHVSVEALPPVHVRVTCGSCSQLLMMEASRGPCSCRCPCGAVYEFQLGGLEKLPAGSLQVRYPSYWSARSEDDRAFEQESDAVRRGVQALLDKTWQSTRTRDRREDKVMRFEVVMVQRNENPKVWASFYRLRCQVAQKLQQQGGCEKHMAKTLAAAEGVPELAALFERARLMEDVNELYLFHGTRPSCAKGICDWNFSVAEAGANAGTRYGPGVYFAEASTKSDEYAKDDKLGIFQGLYGMLLCRVVCGRVHYTDEARPPVQQLVDSVVKDGTHHSVLGDREKCRGTYREFVIYDKDQAYPEYLIVYRRVDPSSPPDAGLKAEPPGT